MNSEQEIINVSLRFVVPVSEFKNETYTMELVTILIANPERLTVLKLLMKAYIQKMQREERKYEEFLMTTYMGFCHDVLATIKVIPTMAPTM
jgi:hypothetical protein